MGVKFVVCSRPLRAFLRVLQVSSPHKNQLSKFQFDLETVDKKSHIVECPEISYYYYYHYYHYYHYYYYYYYYYYYCSRDYYLLYYYDYRKLVE